MNLVIEISEKLCDDSYSYKNIIFFLLIIYIYVAARAMSNKRLVQLLLIT